MKVNNGVRDFSTSVTPKQNLCDGRWHRITGETPRGSCASRACTAHGGWGGCAIMCYLTDDKRKRIKNRQTKMCTDYMNLNAAKIQDMDILEQETYRSVF